MSGQEVDPQRWGQAPVERKRARVYLLLLPGYGEAVLQDLRIYLMHCCTYIAAHALLHTKNVYTYKVNNHPTPYTHVNQ